MSGLLTIGMPLYNEARHLEATLDSLLRQTFREFEIIASNNNSSDETGQILERFAAIDSRLRVFRQPNTVVAAQNFRFVVDACTTPLFMFAAGHDLYEKQFIANVLKPLLDDERVLLSYPEAAWFNDAGVVGKIPGMMDTRGMLPLQRMHVVAWGLVYAYQFYGIFRHPQLKAVLDAADLSGVIGPDHIILTRLAGLGAFAQVPEVLFLMRQTEDFGHHGSYLVKVTGNGKGSEIWEPYLRQLASYLDIAEDLNLDDKDRRALRCSLLQCGLLRYRNTLELFGLSYDDFYRSVEFRQFLTFNDLRAQLRG